MKEKSQFQKPKVSSAYAQKQLDKAEEQFEKFSDDIKSMTMDRTNEAKKEESEGPCIAAKTAEKTNDFYLKPKRSIGPGVDPKTGRKEVFNEKFRGDYDFKRQLVHFIAENREIGSENITLWTKPFGGLDAEEWEVPVNKPVWGPRYLAEKIKKCCYHRFMMQEKTTHSDGMGQFYGTMAVDTTIQRLDAHPVSSRKSVFMGASGF